MRLDLGGCVVRPWKKDDSSALAFAANNRNVWLKLRDSMPHPYTLADAEAYLNRVTADASSQSFCIEVNGTVAGGIGLRIKEGVHRHRAELGYWIAEPCWGRGFMTEVVPAFVANRFAALPLGRIFAEVYANNPASVRVLEKAGFAFEGRLRKNVIKEGEILDTLLYALVR
ncbi:MAG: GNAT family protein [Chthoniobacterales bacterium]